MHRNTHCGQLPRAPPGGEQQAIEVEPHTVVELQRAPLQVECNSPAASAPVKRKCRKQLALEKMRGLGRNLAGEHRLGQGWALVGRVELVGHERERTGVARVA